MAEQLYLEHDGTTLDLLPGQATAGWHAQNWTPAVPFAEYGVEEEPITEVMDCYVTAASDDALATQMQNMAYMVKWASAYRRDMATIYPVWLYAQTAGETNERRALVLGVKVDLRQSPHSVDTQRDHQMRVRLTIERTPYWENPTAGSLPKWSPSAAISYQYDYSSGVTIDGDVPARIDLGIYDEEHAIDSCYGELDWVNELWLGLRSAGKHTDVNDFQEIWECENFILNPAESGIAVASDDCASENERVTVAESDLDWDDTWHEVGWETIRFMANDVWGAASTDQLTAQYGRYLVLCRATVSDTASVWEVRLSSTTGWLASPLDETHYVAKEGEPIEITVTHPNEGHYYWQEAGVFSLPPMGWHADTDPSSPELYWPCDAGIYLEARRTSGTGDLYLDCLGLLPVDEGYCKAWDLYDNGNHTTRIVGGPDGTARVAQEANSRRLKAAPFAWQTFAVATGHGHMIMFHNALYGSFENEGFVFASDYGDYYERWIVLRGSE